MSKKKPIKKKEQPWSNAPEGGWFRDVGHVWESIRPVGSGWTPQGWRPSTHDTKRNVFCTPKGKKVYKTEATAKKALKGPLTCKSRKAHIDARKAQLKPLLDALKKAEGNARKIKSPMRVQSVLVPTSMSSRKALAWLDIFNFYEGDVDNTKNYRRYRQMDPGVCNSRTFKTIPVARSGGIKIVACRKSSIQPLGTTMWNTGRYNG